MWPSVEPSGHLQELASEGDLTSGDEHTVQYTDDVLQNWTPETCIILLAMSPQEIQ